MALRIKPWSILALAASLAALVPLLFGAQRLAVQARVWLKDAVWVADPLLSQLDPIDTG